MTIDTGLRTMRMQVQKQVFAVVAVTLIAILFFGPVAQALRAVAIPRALLVGVIIAAYAAFQLYFYVRDVEYLFVSDTQLPDMLRVRHFRVRALSQAKQAMEIPLHQLWDFQEQTSLWGLRRHIVLRQAIDRRLYVYPPFSVTILRAKELEALRACLAQHAHHAQ